MLLVVVRPGRGLARLSRSGDGRGASRDRASQLERELRPAPDLVVAEEDEGIVAGREERARAGRPRPRARPARSRGGAGAGTGTVRSAGASAARDPPGRSVAHRTAPAAASAATVSSACQLRVAELDGQRQVARPRRRSAPSRASSRATVSGTRKSTVPSRSPKRRYGPVSHGRPGSGVPPNARHEPPRWALTRTGSRRRRRRARPRPSTRTAAGRRCCSARPPASRVGVVARAGRRRAGPRG